MNSELLNQLIDRAVAVLNQHIVPGGISDRDALSELYGIFDGPEYRVAIAAPPAPILAQPDEWCDDCHAYTHREGNPCYPATPPDYALSTTAMDYLQRTGLIGSPLRQVEIAPPAPTGDKSCTGN
jgi:hypothetical protein